MYRQLADLLRGRILEGEVSVGDKIPSEAQLSESFGISRITVRQALAELENAGLLQRVPGKGTFVRGRANRVERLTRLTGFGENMSALGRTVGYRTLRAEERPVQADVVGHLRCSDAKAYVIERVLLADGRPVGMHVSYLPTWLSARDHDGRLFTREALDSGSLYGAIEECGVELYRAEETVEPDLATEYEAETLQMPKGDLLLRVKRVAYDSEGHPVEYVILTYRSDSFTFRLHLYRNPDS
jgi:GntR family transcriptional regulator